MKRHFPILTPFRSLVGLVLVAVLALAFLALAGKSDAQLADVASGRKSIDTSKLMGPLRQRIEADREAGSVPVDVDGLPKARPAGGTILWAYEFSQNRLVSFDASTPGTYLTNVEVTGVNRDNGESIYGIDFRPSDGQLYGLVSRFPVPARVVRINTATGVASPVHPTNTIASLQDTFQGFEVHPAADIIRNVGRERANRRLSPSNGTLLGIDTPLTYAAGDPNAGVTPRIVHAAHTITTGSSSSTLYGIDSEANTLVRIGGINGEPSPNGGTLTTIGPLGFDFTNFGGMDIPPGSSFAYAALNISSVPHLVQIDLATGAGAIIGEIGSGERVIDGLAIPLGPLVLPTPTPTPVPTPTPSPTPFPPNATIIRAVNVVGMSGATTTIPFVMEARGGEKYASFSIAYNAAVLQNPVVSVAPSAAGSQLITDLSQVSSGRIGVTIDLPSPMPAGTRQLITVAFVVSPASFVGTFPITFENTPVPLSIRDLNGADVVSGFAPGFVVVSVTSAGVDVSGRVLTADGRGLRNARVVMTDAGGSRRVVTTGSFGHYRFTDVEAGGSYVISIDSKRYTYSPRLISVADTVTGCDFMPN